MKYKVKIIISIVLTLLFVAAVAVGYILLNMQRNASNDVTKYSIVVEDNITVYEGDTYTIVPHLIDENGTVLASAFTYSTNSSSIEVTEKGVVSVKQAPTQDENVTITVSAPAKQVSTEVNIKVVSNLDQVLGVTFVDPMGNLTLLSGDQKLGYGDVVALNFVTQPKNVELKQFCKTTIRDKNGTEKNVLDIEFDGTSATITTTGLGSGKVSFDVTVDDVVIYTLSFDFDIGISNKVLQQQVLESLGQTLLTKEEIDSVEAVTVKGNVGNLEELGVFPALQTVTVNSDTVLKQDIPTDYSYRVRESIFADCWNSPNWQAVASKKNIYPYNPNSPSTPYAVYHSDKGKSLDKAPINSNLALPVLQFIGYANTGWNANGQPATAETVKAVSGNGIHLDAVWQANSYTIRYDFGNGTVKDEAWTYDVEGTLKSDKFYNTTKIGYNFSCWLFNEQQYDTESKYKNFASEQNSIVTLQAHWTPINYTVHFVLPDDAEPLTDIDATYDEVITLSAAARTGYSFVRWIRKNETDVFYNIGEHQNLTAVDKQVVELEADFTENSYTVNLMILDDEIEVTSNPENVGTLQNKLYTDEFILPTMRKQGFVSFFWMYDIDGDGLIDEDETQRFEEGNTISVSSIVDFVENPVVNLIARGTAASYDIIFNANGGEFGSSSFDGTVVRTYEDSEFDFPVVLRPGYTLVNWTREDTGKVFNPSTDKVPAQLTEETNQKFTFNATWKENSYNLNFYDERGSLYVSKKDLPYTSSVVLPNYTPTNRGYTFIGWQYSNKVHQGGQTMPVSELYPRELTIELRPVVRENKYTIKTVRDGIVNTYEVRYSEEFTFRSYEKFGYTHTGWKCRDNGMTYNATDKVSKLTTTPDAVITFDLVWTPNKYTITRYNGSQGDHSNFKVTVNGTTVTGSNNKWSIDYGATVTIDVSTKDHGTKISSFTRTDNVSLSYTQDGKKYTFVMPACGVTAKVTCTSDHTSCFVAGTLLNTPNGDAVAVENLHVGDDILAFDHMTRQFVSSKVQYIFYSVREVYIIDLKFSDGYAITFANSGHGLYNKTRNCYSYLTPESATSYIGDEFVCVSYENGRYAPRTVTLESVDLSIDYVERYDIVTKHTLNHIANGLLACTDLLVPACNVFEFNEDMSINIEQMQKDIETYGLYTYDDWKDYLTEEEFDAFNGKYFKVAVGKGLLTEEDILELIFYLRDFGKWD